MTHERDSPSEAEFATLRAEIVRTIRTVCPFKLAAQADDIAHNVLVHLMEKCEGPGDRPTSYWRKAAYHAVIDEIRRRRRRSEVPLEDHGPTLKLAGKSPHDPERLVASGELGEAIDDCVKQLLETRRDPVVLFLQGHSVPEAAALLGWAGKRVESALYRGIRDLRACLSGKGWRR